MDIFEILFSVRSLQARKSKAQPYSLGLSRRWQPPGALNTKRERATSPHVPLPMSLNQHLNSSDQHRISPDQHFISSDQHRISLNQLLISSDQHRISPDQYRILLNQHLISTDQHRISLDQHLISSDQHLISRYPSSLSISYSSSTPRLES